MLYWESQAEDLLLYQRSLLLILRKIDKFGKIVGVGFLRSYLTGRHHLPLNDRIAVNSDRKQPIKTVTRVVIDPRIYLNSEKEQYNEADKPTIHGKK